jgi:general secretion pathway protein F
LEAFRYEALDAGGGEVTGVIQADTPRQARVQLRERGLLPSRVDPLRARERAMLPWSRGIPALELAELTRQLATLLGSGLTLEHSLSALLEEAAAPLTRDVLSGVKADISAGLSLARALGNYEKSFPEFYQALVHGGEESGALTTVLQHLADYLDAREALKQKLSLALMYPLLVSFVAIAIVAGLLIYVVPQVVQVFQQSRQTLPLLTRGLILVSDFLRLAWPYLLSALVAGGLAVSVGLRREGPRRLLDVAMLRAVWLGPLVRGVNTSRFASTLAILVGGGVPLIAALGTASRVMTNVVLREGADRAIERVREGAGLARALGEAGEFPPMLIHLIASGELSGQLGPMLERAARGETRKLERRLAVFLTLLEPVMILVMGGVVLMIVLAILLPIIEINQLVR